MLLLLFGFVLKDNLFFFLIYSSVAPLVYYCDYCRSSTSSMEKQLYLAVHDGDADKVLSLMSTNPRLDVNWEDNHDNTPLHQASSGGHVEVVKALLTHPDIRANQKSLSGHAPFSHSCLYGNVPVVRALLKDPRVDITLTDNHGWTPLWWASFKGHQGVVEWLLASGRDLGDINSAKETPCDGKEYTALDIAKQSGHTEIAAVLEKFAANPEKTRRELRVKLGVLDELAAEIFALVIFLCDDQLQLKPALATIDTSNSAALSFFSIVRRLPMEMQMMLCRRVAGSVKDSILSKDSEAAFKSLAGVLLHPSPRRR